MSQPKGYWENIVRSTRSLWRGLVITWVHILKARKSQKPLSIQNKHYFTQTDGIATIQYPHVSLPVPDTGRYRLHNEIEDCIVCDKCVKVCPVDCITIEPIKATEEFGKTSDGTPKRIYAAKFDIDMGKCCFCGLCTTVCPTECLTMTKSYDFSVFDIREHNYAFADMTPEQIEEKKKLLEEQQKAKAATKVEAPIQSTSSPSETPKPSRPVFKPKIKPPGS
jgi:NADH-quinone oxidoreductase subunit I